MSNTNITPINIRSRGQLGKPQQVGSINNNNEVLPLFGRKRYPIGNDNWEYYTLAGDFGVKLNIVSQKKGERLYSKDIVFIKGYNRKPYRVTMYDLEYPQYIPY